MLKYMIDVLNLILSGVQENDRVEAMIVLLRSSHRQTVGHLMLPPATSARDHIVTSLQHTKSLRRKISYLYILFPRIPI